MHEAKGTKSTLFHMHEAKDKSTSFYTHEAKGTKSTSFHTHVLRFIRTCVWNEVNFVPLACEDDKEYDIVCY